MSRKPELYKLSPGDEYSRSVKRWIVACLVAGTTLVAAQTPTPPATAVGAGTPEAAAPLEEPLSTTSPDDTRYQAHPELLAACQARLSALGNKPCDVLFIGDTATTQWLKTGRALWEKLYAPRHALNLGVDGDKIQNVLWRISNLEGIQSLKPKVTVLLIGTNNIANTSHEIADGIKAIVVTLQANFPGVKIILISILPNERATDKMRQANSLIRGTADNSSVFYLDLASKMPSATVTGADGRMETEYQGIGPDHLNPDAKGYQIWAETMEPLLSGLLSGK